MNTIFLIVNEDDNNVIGYVVKFEEALRIVSEGKLNVRYEERPVSELDLSLYEQTCYENLYNC